jgi:hypothetical protein
MARRRPGPPVDEPRIYNDWLAYGEVSGIADRYLPSEISPLLSRASTRRLR